MKIAIVFGKGLDGCGVEKFGYEFQRHMPDEVDIYDLQERGFTRSGGHIKDCLLYTSPSPRDSCASRMPSSA